MTDLCKRVTAIFSCKTWMIQVAYCIRFDMSYFFDMYQILPIHNLFLLLLAFIILRGFLVDTSSIYLTFLCMLVF